MPNNEDYIILSEEDFQVAEANAKAIVDAQLAEAEVERAEAERSALIREAMLQLIMDKNTPKKEGGSSEVST